MSNVHVIKADMADNRSLIAAAAETEKIAGGTVDYLIVNGVNQNAQENFLSPTEFVGKEDLLTSAMMDSVNVNLLGVIFTINAFLPLVRKSSVKKITVISTGLADRDMAEQSIISFSVTYSSIKAALNIVVAKYAAELKPEGIVVLALSPGLVDTGKHDQMPPEIAAKVSIMMKDFKIRYPEWSGAPLTPAESVMMQKKVIEDVGIERTGGFLSHHGNKSWL